MWDQTVLFLPWDHFVKSPTLFQDSVVMALLNYFHIVFRLRLHFPPRGNQISNMLSFILRGSLHSLKWFVMFKMFLVFFPQRNPEKAFSPQPCRWKRGDPSRRRVSQSLRREAELFLPNFWVYGLAQDSSQQSMFPSWYELHIQIHTGDQMPNDFLTQYSSATMANMRCFYISSYF